MSKITKKGPKAPAWFQEWFQSFLDNQFIPLVEVVKKDHEILMQVKQSQEQDHKLLCKVIKLNKLKTK